MVIRMVSRMVIHMVILRGGGGGGTPYDYHMVKINHMVKIWKISSKNPNHYYLLNLHLQLLKFQIFAAKQQAARHQADDNDVTDRQRRDRPRARPRGRTPGARSAPRLPCLPVPARQRRTACCDAGRLCARGQALECRMDARRVARTGVCARVMPVQLLAVGSHGGTAHGNAVSCASLPAGEPLRGSWGDGARPAARRRTLGCHDLCEFASGSRPARLRRKRREASEQVHGRPVFREAGRLTARPG